MRATTRTAAMISAGLGLALLATTGTVGWLRAGAAASARNDAVQATTARATEVSTSLAIMLRRDADLLLTLSREPSFGEWEDLPGSVRSKLAQRTGEAAGFRAEMRAAFADYARLFPQAFQTLQVVDTQAVRPIAQSSDGAWLTAETLPEGAGAGQIHWLSQTLALTPGEVFVSPPYRDGDGTAVISIATPLVGRGAKAIVLTTLPIARLQSAMIQASNANGDATALVDRRDGSVITSGSATVPVSPALGKQVNDKMAHSKGAVAFPVGARTVTGVPAGVAEASGFDLSWLAVVADGPLPVTGLSAALPPLMLLIGFVGLLFLLLALLLALRLRRRAAVQAAVVVAERDRFAQGMDQLTNALTRTSNGNLATRLNVELGDEAMTGLAASFDQTLGSLRELVAQAQTNSRQLNTAATELGASSRQQASSASQQSAVVTQTTATIAELAATAEQIAENSEAVVAVAEQTLAKTIEGRNAVEESVAAIESVNGQVAFIASACEGLGEKIIEIGEILAIIDELSDQTNLLALNAAIEAARAGEHGRGFAVVAAEIRRLAERSQESTVLIQSIITDISNRARQTVDASAQGSHAVQAVTDQARAAAASLERIAALVDTSTSAAREISSATRQQRSASEQVVQAMADVSSTAAQFAAGAKQSASSAQEIADLAVRTQMSISHFVTEADSTDSTDSADEAVAAGSGGADSGGGADGALHGADDLAGEWSEQESAQLVGAPD